MQVNEVFQVFKMHGTFLVFLVKLPEMIFWEIVLLWCLGQVFQKSKDLSLLWLRIFEIIDSMEVFVPRQKTRVARVSVLYFHGLSLQGL